MKTLERALVDLVQAQRITREEALLKTSRPEELQRILDQI
jgi:Tfp pilus assembly pilus retraction ATPase PilT